MGRRKREGRTLRRSVSLLGMISGMESEAPVQVMLEIDSTAEPIAGWMHTAAFERRRFVGMLELISLLEQMRDDGPGEESRGGGPG